MIRLLLGAGENCAYSSIGSELHPAVTITQAPAVKSRKGQKILLVFILSPPLSCFLQLELSLVIIILNSHT